MYVSRLKSNSARPGWLFQGLGLVLAATLGFSATAVRMDETTHDQIIDRLEMGLEGMGKNRSRPHQIHE